MSASLSEIIKRRISQLGPMDVGEYMALCLSHPDHGYYMTRDPFGSQGDFTTAPEISQLFGEMIGVWMADAWIKLGSPGPFALVECGPGRGTLMADIMRATAKVPGFREAARIHLMEISPVLKAKQAEMLSAYSPVWIDDLEGVPADMPVLLVGNEFFDALPVRQLERRNGQWLERVIGLGEGDVLAWGVKDADPHILAALPERILKDGADGIYETPVPINHFVKSLSNILLKQRGAALFLDYGYSKSKAGDSLQAIRSHRFVDVFDTPGASDLTVHVDFENVRRVAERNGAVYVGPVTQAEFLRAMGIEIRAERLAANADVTQGDSLRAGLLRLIDTSVPESMGALFKVCALCHDESFKPAGFP